VVGEVTAAKKELLLRTNKGLNHRVYGEHDSLSNNPGVSVIDTDRPGVLNEIRGFFGNKVEVGNVETGGLFVCDRRGKE
jgi:hypothetical protein